MAWLPTTIWYETSGGATSGFVVGTFKNAHPEAGKILVAGHLSAQLRSGTSMFDYQIVANGHGKPLGLSPSAPLPMHDLKIDIPPIILPHASGPATRMLEAIYTDIMKASNNFGRFDLKKSAAKWKGGCIHDGPSASHKKSKRVNDGDRSEGTRSEVLAKRRRIDEETGVTTHLHSTADSQRREEPRRSNRLRAAGISERIQNAFDQPPPRNSGSRKPSEAIAHAANANNNTSRPRKKQQGRTDDQSRGSDVFHDTTLLRIRRDRDLLPSQPTAHEDSRRNKHHLEHAGKTYGIGRDGFSDHPSIQGMLKIADDQVRRCRAYHEARKMRDEGQDATELIKWAQQDLGRIIQSDDKFAPLRAGVGKGPPLFERRT